MSHRKISAESGNFPDTLDDFDRFGSGVATIGDLDGDGIPELAVGASSDVNHGPVDPNVANRGAVWVLFLDADGDVRDFTKIGVGNGFGTGAFVDDFGYSVAAIGDLDGDGLGDIVVGAQGDDDGGNDRGAVYVIFLQADGTARAWQKISSTEGGFTGPLDDIDLFGTAVAGLGDVDGDGVNDIAVGARGDDDGAEQNVGAVHVLLLEADGTVKADQKIAEGQGGLSGTLAAFDFFGGAVAGLGDLDGDGVGDLAVGLPGADGVRLSEGAVWILFLNGDGTVRAQQTISSVAGGFSGVLDQGDLFGSSIASLGDLDGDGVADLAVALLGDQDGSTGSGDQKGALYVLFLQADGTVHAQQKISATQGGFGGTLRVDEAFGRSVCGLGDLDGDGAIEVGVGTEGPERRGGVWVLSLAADGTAAAEHRILDGESGFPESTLEGSFGHAMAALGDVDGDGIGDLAVSEALPSFISGSNDAQRIWILFLDAQGAVRASQRIEPGRGGLPADALDGLFAFGRALAALGDLDGDGVVDLATSAMEVGGSGGTGSSLGRTFVLFLQADGTVREHRVVQIPRAELQEGDIVGTGLASPGDVDGDGVADLVAGAPGDGDGVGFDNERGAVYVQFLNADGTLKGYQKISSTRGGLTNIPLSRAHFGDAVGALGDLDGDGVVDLAVGAQYEDEGGVDRGAVYLLFLNPDGTVKADVKIGSAHGFPGLVDDGQFGGSLVGPGDLDGDGVRDLVVGSPGPTDSPTRVLFLNRDGSVEAHASIGRGLGGFAGHLDPFDFFGSSVAALGDRDGDGVTDIAVGARGDDDGGAQLGAVWLLDLDGIACLAFETSDEAVRHPLENGRAVASPAGFGRTLLVSGQGANLGPALFDSTPMGPNDPSQDRDLLLGRGNVLILQNSLAPTQTVAGIFDRPNDDQDGGTLTLTFAQGPVRPLHVDLIDVDPGSGQMSTVWLFDAAGRTRVWDVPAGWTEDLLTHGAPAYRTLDLTSLDPQPGFQATATASEMAGFDLRSVVRIEVRLGSSGAIDDLCWDPHPDS